MASSDASRSFALKETAGDISGLTTAGADGKTIDVLKRLNNGNGVITTDDPAEISALEQLEVLKDAPAKSGKKGDS